MACKNDSSQVKACLTDPELSRESRAGTSQESMDGSSQQQKHSQSYRPEPSDMRQKSGAEPPFGCTWAEGKLKKEPECHMQLDTLSANRHHTVLIDVEEFYAGRIVPYKGKHLWHRGHVKLPHVKLHQHPENTMESRWSAIERALRKITHGGASVGDVEEAVKTYNQAHKRDWSFEGLYNYVQHVPTVETDFSNLIAKMAKLALKLPELIQHSIPLLSHNSNHAITMSQEQISCLLAHAFFCTFPDRNGHSSNEYNNLTTVNFNSLFADRSPRKFQKLRALFHYFSVVTKEDRKRTGLVTFQRISMSSHDCPQWIKQTENMPNIQVYSEGSIEKQGEGMLQVDFAARFVGGGVLGQGLVQEEICFLQCPELIVARLFTEKLAENECLKITGAEMYNSTKGYSDSFEWYGPHQDHVKRDEWNRCYRQIVAIDALNFDDPREQFTEKNIKRELFKAYVGFKGDPNVPTDYMPAIATGNWGCGAFKGDPMLKALIQIMAAAVAQRDVAYFTFGNKKQADDLQRMYELLKTRKVTVGKLYGLLLDYCKHYSRHPHKAKNLFDYITDKIVVHSSQL